MGTAPTLLGTGASGRVQGSEVDLSAQYRVNGPFSFTGFEITVQGPFTSGGTQTYSGSGGITVSFTNPVDPGPFVTVPEPSVSAQTAIALGATVLVWLRRRGVPPRA